MLHKEYNRKCSVREKITGRESQGAWRQEELIGRLGFVMEMKYIS
jgi:hypothetical protein